MKPEAEARTNDELRPPAQAGALPSSHMAFQNSLLFSICGLGPCINQLWIYKSFQLLKTNEG